MKRKHRKAGVSIAEMCIVLALLGIVGTVVVSFSAMVSARSSASATKLNASQDLEMSELILSNWVDRMTGLNAQFAADETGLSATVEGQAYTVTLEEDVLVAPLPDGQKLTCPINEVQEIRFQQMTRPDGNPLIFCTLVYTVASPAGSQSVMEETFTILSRVGEIVSR